MLRERPEDAAAACDLGVPKSLAALLSRANGETGEAALALLAALADDAAARERLRQARCAKKRFWNLGRFCGRFGAAGRGEVKPANVSGPTCQG